jgi:hypothetical protein
MYCLYGALLAHTMASPGHASGQELGVSLRKIPLDVCKTVHCCSSTGATAINTLANTSCLVVLCKHWLGVPGHDTAPSRRPCKLH